MRCAHTTLQPASVSPQKWSKGKVKEKAQNLVLFDEEVYAKLNKEVPKFKLITTSVISDRLKVRSICSLVTALGRKSHDAE